MTGAAGTAPQGDGGGSRWLILVTGMSGAGISTTLKTFEDLGYEAIDNLPLALLGPLLDQAARHGRPTAVGIDTRTRDFAVETLLTTLDSLRGRAGTAIRLVFVDADDEALQRRFTETRRRHPLADDRPVPDGIRRERTLLAPLRDHADLVIDTSLTTAQDLRRLLAGHFALDRQPGLHVFVTSFSFRRGLPREADLVFDVRFLENPHWVPELRPLTGQHEAVQRMIATDPHFAPFLERLYGLIEPLLPRYSREGKSYLTIAIGCTGGRHRSVHVAELLAGRLAAQGYKVGLNHRDLPQG